RTLGAPGHSWAPCARPRNLPMARVRGIDSRRFDLGRRTLYLGRSLGVSVATPLAPRWMGLDDRLSWVFVISRRAGPLYLGGWKGHWASRSKGPGVGYFQTFGRFCASAMAQIHWCENL